MNRREDARIFQEGQHSLIPVLLRESILDSVTFRATAKHFEDQVDAIDAWLTAFCKHTHDFATQFAKLEDMAINMHGKAVPTFIESGIIDTDFTVTAMSRCSDANRAYWKAVFGHVKAQQATITGPLIRVQSTELKEIRNLSGEFHKQQKAYDDMLRYYCQQPKTKEASSLREDAFQLYEKRKAYIKASFDYTIKMSSFRAALDAALITSFSGAFENTANHTSAMATDYASRPSMSSIMTWSNEMKKASRDAEEYLYALRLEMEDDINKLVSPSRELTEYYSPKKTRLTARNHKQGWLMLRAVTGKPARYIWLRKWCFIKRGMFGWLGNTKNGGVEESERYGVLLCNVRIPIEDRRFCFEVLTKDSTILFQAETEAELNEWLNVFECAKKAVLESGEASAVFKPAQEFAAAPLALDSEKHTRSDSNPLVGVNSVFLGKVDDHHFNPFDSIEESLAPPTLAPAPINTALTKASLLDLSTSVAHEPSGTQANHWGSINYGMLNAMPEGKGYAKLLAIPETIVDLQYSKQKIVGPKHYPADYPQDLKRQDAQFCSLFPHARAEHVLMVIRATRKQGQTFSGRMYITLRGLYFYSQSAGLVLVQSCLFSEIMSVRTERQSNYSELIFDVHDIGEARMSLYLDDADLVCRRIELLLANYIADEPQGTIAMLNQLSRLLPDIGHTAKVVEEDITKFKLPLEPVLVEPDIQGLGKVYDAQFGLTAKALFHLLYGNRSPVWSQFFRDYWHHRQVQQTSWQLVEDGTLARAFRYYVHLDKLVIRQDTQRIIKREEHLDYVVMTYVRPWHLPGELMVHVKYNITFVSKTQSRLRIWVDLKNTSLKRLLGRAALETARIATSQITHIVEREALDRLGIGSKTSKAVRIYGRVGGQAEPQPIEPDTNIPIIRRLTYWQLARMYPEAVLLTITDSMYDVYAVTNKFITAHLAILSLLLASVLINIVLTSNTFHTHMIGTMKFEMTRQITLSEIEQLNSHRCYDKLARSPELSRKRNTLLVEMQLLNSVDLAVSQAERNLYLSRETEICQSLNETMYSTVSTHCDACLSLQFRLDGALQDADLPLDSQES